MTVPIHALYVDDDPMLLKLGQIYLEKIGDFTVTTAPGAVEAIRLLTDESFDVIISDYEMPKMDGMEFLNLLHKKNCPCQHIALMTGCKLNDARLLKIEKEGVKLFKKPFSIEEFIGWVSLI